MLKMIELLNTYGDIVNKCDSFKETLMELREKRHIYLKCSIPDDSPKSKSTTDPTYQLAEKHIKLEKRIAKYDIRLAEELKKFNEVERWLKTLETKDKNLIMELYCKHFDTDIYIKKKQLSKKYSITVPTINRWVKEILKGV